MPYDAGWLTALYAILKSTPAQRDEVITLPPPPRGMLIDDFTRTFGFRLDDPFHNESFTDLPSGGRMNMETRLFFPGLERADPVLYPIKVFHSTRAPNGPRSVY